MLKKFIAIVCALVFSTSVHAQNGTTKVAAPQEAAARIIPSPKPVVCTTHEWSSGKSSLIVKLIDASTGKAYFDGVTSGGMPWSSISSNIIWSYDKATRIVRAEGRNGRYILKVEASSLRGSYENFNVPISNRSDLVYVCDGPLSRVTVPSPAEQ